GWWRRRRRRRSRYDGRGRIDEVFEAAIRVARHLDRDGVGVVDANRMAEAAALKGVVRDRQAVVRVFQTFLAVGHHLAVFAGRALHDQIAGDRDDTAVRCIDPETGRGGVDPIGRVSGAVVYPIV